MATVEIKQTTATVCPVCGVKGKRVPLETVPALVKPDLQSAVREQPYRFCDSPQCDVVYFSESDPQHQFKRADLRVRVGQKETAPPIQVCYCFDWTVEDIEREFGYSGKTTILDRIRKKVQQGFCRCETMNPQGTCCLGNVAKAVKEAERKLHGSTPGLALSVHDVAYDECLSGSDGAVIAKAKASGRERGAVLATIGTVFSAVVASACCWLPLLLLAIGISGVGIASLFEQYRSIFLTGTFALLALAWYLTYQPTIQRWLARHSAADRAPSPDSRHACCAIQRDEESAAPESCCATAAGSGRFSVREFNRVMPWVATAVVLVFAFFPHWIGLVLQRGAGADQPDIALTWHNVRVEGMTCEGCAATLEKAIRQVPGVRQVHVSYKHRRAVIGTEAGQELLREQVLDAIEKAGYQGELIDDLAIPAR